MLKQWQVKLSGARLFPVLCIILFTVSCADHESGYYDGYSNAKARRWLLLGRAAYAEGYQQGHMQAFQDDWYAENADEMVVGQSCPLPTKHSNPVVFIDKVGLVQLN